MFGLPIGNLTSQIFANFFLSDFDHFVLTLVVYYGRYVDDFYLILVGEDAYFVIQQIDNYLESLGLTLHPNKLYIQPATKGIRFIGAVIKPGRIYVSNRTKGYMWQVLQHEKPTSHFISSINSYLGQMIHFNTYSLRRKMLRQIKSPNIIVSGDYSKISLTEPTLLIWKTGGWFGWFAPNFRHHQTGVNHN